MKFWSGETYECEFKSSSQALSLQKQTRFELLERCDPAADLVIRLCLASGEYVNVTLNIGTLLAGLSHIQVPAISENDGKKASISLDIVPSSEHKTHTHIYKIQPSPSLTQCYKMNQEACCVSAHDGSIESQYESLLTPACLREYEQLEQYFCLGCSPEMFNFIQWYDADTKVDCAVGGTGCTFKRFDAGSSANWEDQRKDGKYGMLRLCNSFLDSLFFSDKTCSVTDGTCEIDRFDNCGLYVEENGQSMGILPSSYFRNSTTNTPDYIKFIEMIRPPYFSSDDFDISVEYLRDSNSNSDDQYYHEAWDSDAVCLSSASRVSVAFTVSALSLILAFFSVLKKNSTS